MPINRLLPKQGPEYREISWKRGFWKNFFTVFLFAAVFFGLIFLAVLLYVGPPVAEVVDNIYGKITALIKK